MAKYYIIGTKDNRYLSIAPNKVFFTDNVNLASCFESLEALVKFEDQNPNLYNELTYPYTIEGREQIIKEIQL